MSGTGSPLDWQVSDLDFFEATREFVTAHGWAKDTNGATLDVPELFNLVERWQVGWQRWSAIGSELALSCL